MTCKGVRFFQNEYDDKFKNMGVKFQKLEEKINLLKKELHVIQTTKPLYATQKDAKLVDLEDCPRRNNLGFKGIKEHESE